MATDAMCMWLTSSSTWRNEASIGLSRSTLMATSRRERVPIVPVIETMSFRLAPGTDEQAFLGADGRVQTEFAYRQPGLLRRTTAHTGDGEWIVIDVWQSAAEADACNERWDTDPVP